MSAHRRPTHRPTRIATGLVAGVIVAVVGSSQPAWAPPHGGPFHEDASLDTSQVVKGETCELDYWWLDEYDTLVKFCHGSESEWWSQ